MPRIKSLPIGTKVTIVGCQTATYNGQQGEIETEFDGMRYGVRMDANRKDIVRIVANKLIPVMYGDFLRHVRRLTHEIIVFLNHHTSDGVHISTLATKNAKELIRPNVNAFRPSTNAICLQDDGILVLYDTTGAYAHIRQVSEPNGTVRHFTIRETDVYEHINAQTSMDLVDVLGVWCTSQERMFWFSNREYPRFHLSPGH